jgi:hypothetical protein
VDPRLAAAGAAYNEELLGGVFKRLRVSRRCLRSVKAPS